MESWENKIVKNKTDSLQHLPDGYLPDLSSKWEIIEAGLREKKRVVPLLVKWSVAAAIAACIIVAGIKINVHRNVPVGLGVLTSMPFPGIDLSVERKPAIAFVNVPVPDKAQPQKKVFTVPETVKKLVVKDKSLPLVSKEIKTNVVDDKIDSIAANINDLAAVAVEPQTPKRAKRSTFQKDFNDDLLVMDTGYSKPGSSQFSFKLQLHKPSTDETPPSRRLQLKQIL